MSFGVNSAKSSIMEKNSASSFGCLDDGGGMRFGLGWRNEAEVSFSFSFSVLDRDVAGSDATLRDDDENENEEVSWVFWNAGHVEVVILFVPLLLLLYEYEYVPPDGENAWIPERNKRHIDVALNTSLMVLTMIQLQLVLVLYYLCLILFF